jgi:hypothetical protein
MRESGNIGDRAVRTIIDCIRNERDKMTDVSGKRRGSTCRSSALSLSAFIDMRSRHQPVVLQQGNILIVTSHDNLLFQFAKIPKIRLLHGILKKRFHFLDRRYLSGTDHFFIDDQTGRG